MVAAATPPDVRKASGFPSSRNFSLRLRLKLQEAQPPKY
jgi:hypothetical protein